MRRSKATFREFLAAGVANILPIAMGVTLGWPSPMLLKLTDSKLVDNPVGYAIAESEQSWINSMLAIGGFFGPFMAGYLADRKGRKVALLLSGVIHVVGWIVLLLANTVSLMIVARFMLGFANGCTVISLAMYTGEISSDKHRGILGSFLQIGQTIGTLYVYCIGPYVNYFAFQWICCAVPLLFILTFFFMPETPHFFVSKGMDQRAAASLMYLRDASIDDIQPDLQVVKQYVVQEASVEKTGAFRSLFTKRANLRALMITVCLISLQQWTGIDCILSNSELIFSKAQVLLSADISTIILGAVQFICCCFTLFVVDRTGRKPILMGSAAGLSVALAILGTYFLLDRMDIAEQHISWMPLTGMIGFIAIFSFGFGPVPWAIASEIFAHDVKALGNTINVSTLCLLDFLALRFFLLISESFGFEWAFWIFAIVCAVAFVFTLMCVVETKGLALHEIQERLASGKPSRPKHDGACVNGES